ncbi:Uncharacterised protein [Mycobacteroides abscessus subsp. abscessus]|nr:Uncharacterised protein [Mycobacteroides abscessus subsp. abscessus]
MFLTPAIRSSGLAAIRRASRFTNRHPSSGFRARFTQPYRSARSAPKSS